MTIKEKRIAWCITGSGHYLKESIDIMNQIKNIDLFLSKAGEEVLKWYNYELDDFKSSGMKIFKDVTASAAPVSLLYEGVYKLVVVSPATSNTVAQMAYGLSDNLESLYGTNPYSPDTDGDGENDRDDSDTYPNY